MIDFLEKGVFLHSFIDSSGCVFFNSDSGETLSVKLTEANLIEFICSEQRSDIENLAALSTLVQKGFLKPSTIKESYVE
ncbi:hypothetical protein [Paraglaciecola sp. 2405UD69-4]|uniref:hypothetical protein n=1 Tax=Paraglaciecola sp. 2405UD69-4 TaxID=3391836 RepID=UPI0039C92AAE